MVSTTATVHPLLRSVRVAIALRGQHSAAIAVFGHRFGNEVGKGLRHRQVDVLAAACAAAEVKGLEDGQTRGRSAQGVRQHCAQDTGTVATVVTRYLGYSAEHVGCTVQADVVFHRACAAEGAQGKHYYPWVHPAQCLIVQAQLGQGAGGEVLQHDVADLDQFFEQLDSPGRCQVQGTASFIGTHAVVHAAGIQPRPVVGEWGIIPAVIRLVDSTLMTSTPSQASNLPQFGTEMTCPMSRMRTPSRGNLPFPGSSEGAITGDSWLTPSPLC